MEKGTMVDNRISLRLDDNEIKTIDKFLESHTEFASRSHLAREAIRRFIYQEDGGAGGTAGEAPENRRVIKIVAAPAVMHVLEQMVRGGYFVDENEAAYFILKNHTINKDNRLDKTIDSICDSRERLVQVDREH
jgi:Arc/MetJ-type ribon-helix-helix transcriptional regulator